MRVLAFDTETTGVKPEQDYVVQLAWVLHNTDNGKDEMIGNMIRTPIGFEIPEGAAEVHGITTAYAKQHGLPMTVILNAFTQAIVGADIVVGHNVEFDKQFISNEYRSELEQNNGWPLCFDTMAKNVDIVKLPLSEKQQAAQAKFKLPDGSFEWQPDGGWPTYKNPNLTETYRHYFGSDFDNAHDALADVRATLDIYLKMQEVQSAQ